MRVKIFDARMVQQRRGFYNARIPSRQLRSICALDEPGERPLDLAVRASASAPARMTGD